MLNEIRWTVSSSAVNFNSRAYDQVMNDTREAYARLFQTDLVTAMEGEWKVGGDFKRILCALAKKHPAHVQVGLA